MSDTDNNQILAERIALGLGDEKSLPMFLAMVRRYPEDVVRRAYEETLGYPADKIRKSRGAIFVFLVKKYGRQSQSNS